MSSSDEEEDLHQCGRCKEIFRDLDKYLSHKRSKSCHKEKKAPSLKPTQGVEDGTEASRTNDNLQTDSPQAKKHPPETHPKTADVKKKQDDLPKGPLTKRNSKVESSVASQVQQSQVKSDPKKVRPKAKDTNAVSKDKGPVDEALPATRRSKRRRSAPKRPFEDDFVEADGSHENDSSKTVGKESKQDSPTSDQIGELPVKQPRKRGRPSRFASFPEHIQQKVVPSAPAVKTYKCPKCEFSVQNHVEFDRHMRRSHNLSKYWCEKCFMPFSDRYKLRRHAQAQKCNPCTGLAQGSENFMEFGKSNKIFHKVKEDGNSDQEADPEEKVLDAAKPSETSNKQALINHSDLQPGADFSCQECSASCSSYTEIKEHVSSHHSHIAPGICRFCGRWFTTKYHLWRHVASTIHDDIPDADLEQVKNELKDLKVEWPSANDDKASATTKRTKKKYNCPDCNKQCSAKTYLDKHIRKVHGIIANDNVTLFQCRECNKLFDKASSLNKHARIVHHQAAIVAPAECGVCGRSFKHSGHVMRHVENLHTPVLQAPLDLLRQLEEQAKETQENQGPRDENLTGQEDMPENAKDTSSDREQSLDSSITDQARKTISSCIVNKEDENVCFVCSKCTSPSTLQDHLHHHRVWTPHPEKGCVPPDLFDYHPQPPPLVKDAPKQWYTVPSEESTVDICKKSNSTDSTNGVTKEAMVKDKAGGQSGGQMNTIDHEALSSLIQEINKVNRVLEGNCSLDEVEECSQSQTDELHHDDDDNDDDTSHLDTLKEKSLTVLGSVSVIGTENSHDTPSNPSSLSKHSPNENDSDHQQTMCPYCLKSFPSLLQLYTHKTEHHQLVLLYQCCLSDCMETFTSAAKYEQHHRNVHKQVAFICNICNHHVDELNALTAHKQSKHRKWHRVGEEENLCHICNKVFPDKEQFLTHVKNTRCHFSCSTCGKVFKKKNELRNHEALHGTGKSFLCDECGNTLNSKLALVRHKMTHTVRKHQCEHCQVTFNKKEHLRRHIMTKHTEGKQFVCTFPGCDRDFKRKDKLKEHYKSHTTEKKYSCEVCGRRYRYREGLRYHLKTHEKNTGYKCSICGIETPRPSQLRQHMKEIHEITVKETHVYRCTVCNSSFSRPERVKRHMEKEHSIKADWTTHCNICNRGFAGVKSLENHMRVRHTSCKARKKSLKANKAVENETSQIEIAPKEVFTVLQSEQGPIGNQNTTLVQPVTTDGLVNPQQGQIDEGITHFIPVQQGHNEWTTISVLQPQYITDQGGQMISIETVAPRADQENKSQEGEAPHVSNIIINAATETAISGAAEQVQAANIKSTSAVIPHERVMHMYSGKGEKKEARSTKAKSHEFSYSEVSKVSSRDTKKTRGAVSSKEGLTTGPRTELYAAAGNQPESGQILLQKLDPKENSVDPAMVGEAVLEETQAHMVPVSQPVNHHQQQHIPQQQPMNMQNPMIQVSASTPATSERIVFVQNVSDLPRVSHQDGGQMPQTLAPRPTQGQLTLPALLHTQDSSLSLMTAQSLGRLNIIKTPQHDSTPSSRDPVLASAAAAQSNIISIPAPGEGGVNSHVSTQAMVPVSNGSMAAPGGAEMLPQYVIPFGILTQQSNQPPPAAVTMAMNPTQQVSAPNTMTAGLQQVHGTFINYT